MLKKKFLFIQIILFIITFSGCSNISNNEAVSKTDFYFDTVVTITLYGSENSKYIDECFEICKNYENMLSRTVKDSEISQINNNIGSFVEVSDDTLELINKGIYYSELSGGKFDITIGGLSSLWNFNSENPRVPAKADINNALQSVGYKKLQVDNNNVMLNNEETILDLGGIAKGFIADKLKEYLLSEKIDSGIIDLGGNILLVGSKPDGSDYKIGIKKPFSDTGENSAIMNVHDKSIVSSGNYERYFYEDGKLYHHILDTDTGYPVDNNLYSVSIISDSSVDGDGLSTTCFLLGIDKGMELIESLDNIEAVFIDSDYKVYYSSGLNEDNGIFTLVR
ncbi:MAG: FAD:protein FMN transferase [Lachnospiraceae bacterium]|nr:FAD:protein FMN transferase [Lachnospiraceae bacterium]